jgi:large subunit ribosomal protein L2
MPIIIKKRLTPGTRNISFSDFSEVTTTTPEKSLLVSLAKNGGRNQSGQITVRHRGGGNRRFYRLVDFKRSKVDVPAKVISVEYDPNRSARIALIVYVDGTKSYILAPAGLNVNDVVMSGPQAEIKPGNHIPLKNIPVGTMIYNVEITLGRGGQLGRSAGMQIQLLAKEGKYGVIRLPSGEQRMILLTCSASVGQASNVDHYNVRIGTAGRKRHMGWRPVVRGAVMNPNDHPHGGGEGKAPVGRKNPRDLWGNIAYGVKSRDSKKPSSNFILRRRKSKRNPHS